MQISKAWRRGIVALALSVAMPVMAEPAVGCDGAVAAAGPLVERVAQALGWRSRERMWPTAVLETGRPGMRRLLVYVGPKDVDLRPIPARFHPLFRNFAFTVDLQQAARQGLLQIIRDDEDGTTVRLEFHSDKEFPSRATDAARRMDLAETREHHHARAREELSYPHLLGWFRQRVTAPLYVRMDFRLVRHRQGFEAVEAVVVEVALPGPNGPLTYVAKGTDR